MLSNSLTSALTALRAASVALGLALLTTAGGCRSLGKQPVAENVVEAREMSLRGLDAMQRGRHEEAEQLFAAAIKTCPVDERARRNYADLLWKRGEYGQAVKQMEEAVRLSGGDAGLLVQLGQMQLARGEHEAARQSAERAVAADRQRAAAWALLGDTQRVALDLDRALASYHRALSLEEFQPNVQEAVAELYHQQNKPQRALATLSALADRYGPGQVPTRVLVKQGVTLKQLNRYDDAAEMLSTAIAQSGNQPDIQVLYELADAQVRAGEQANAVLTLRAALQQAPQHYPSQQLLLTLETGAGNGMWR